LKPKRNLEANNGRSFSVSVSKVGAFTLTLPTPIGAWSRLMLMLASGQGRAGSLPAHAKDVATADIAAGRLRRRIGRSSERSKPRRSHPDRFVSARRFTRYRPISCACGLGRARISQEHSRANAPSAGRSERRTTTVSSNNGTRFVRRRGGQLHPGIRQHLQHQPDDLRCPLSSGHRGCLCQSAILQE